MMSQINARIDDRIVQHFKRTAQDQDKFIGDAISEAMQLFIQKNRRMN